VEDNQQAQIDTFLRHLEVLIQRGRHIRDALSDDPSNAAAIAAHRAWHQDCGVTINQLSGGSKAHWLARAFSEAFLMRSTSGQAIESIAPAQIVDRLTVVLEHAVQSLTRMKAGEIHSTGTEAAPSPRRFEFVHNAELKLVLEQAYADGRSAMEQGDFGLALVTSCGILEAIVTDALEFKGIHTLADAVVPKGTIAEWPFETRLAVAEGAGLIRGGWARLPQMARGYRDLVDSDGNPRAMVSERDARIAGQVLQVVMRDLDPGR